MMTLEEAKQILSDWNLCHYTPSKEAAEAVISAIDPLDIITALRSPTREMVERIRGEWKTYFNGDYNDERIYCSECGRELDDECHTNFCPHCGAPMTDEAVEMMLERMEALHDNRT